MELHECGIFISTYNYLLMYAFISLYIFISFHFYFKTYLFPHLFTYFDPPPKNFFLKFKFWQEFGTGRVWSY